MMTVTRKAISAVIGMAVMPVSYTCRATEIGRHVLLVIPLGPEWPQDEQYGNPFERHLSEWSAGLICSEWPVLRHRLFRDYLGRIFGVFIITRREQDRLAFDLQSESSDGLAALEFEREQALAFIAQEKSVGDVRVALQQWQERQSQNDEMIAFDTLEQLDAGLLQLIAPHTRGDRRSRGIEIILKEPI